MGFTAGFVRIFGSTLLLFSANPDVQQQTGGVALTLAVAYMTTVGQLRAREDQSLLVQQQSRTLDTAIDHPAAPRRPTRAELAAASRANFTDRAKDRWNAEVEGAVRWLQNADWDRARERAEDRVGTLVGATGADAAVEKVAAAAQEKGAVVKEELGDIVEKSVSKGRDVVGEVESVVDDAAEPESAVQRALRQRYEKEPAKAKTVTEVLKERYLPLDQRDNTVLRGI